MAFCSLDCTVIGIEIEMVYSWEDMLESIVQCEVTLLGTIVRSERISNREGLCGYGVRSINMNIQLNDETLQLMYRKGSTRSTQRV